MILSYLVATCGLVNGVAFGATSAAAAAVALKLAKRRSGALS